MIHIARQILLKKTVSQNDKIIKNHNDIKNCKFKIIVQNIIKKINNNYNSSFLRSILIDKFMFRRR